ncbi:complement component C1q receptor [Kryptolebias marmoratus]|uniref:complement component C1q receptor n=1 Tax=Kryptolebias marmoratus TaxID=37003 RepID=UPI0007F8FD6B|nr:complement component C1q receptor [Kryptolebias marmoratus]
MLLILLLQLIYNFQSSLGAEHETLCTSDACITLHNKELSFDEAQRDCVDNGGNLITLRDKNEESKLLELIKTHHSKRLKIWIGLKRNKKDCMIAVTPLKGFQWISGEEDSQYSNWKKDPASTCLERCVKVNYTSSDPDQLKWTDAACKHPAFYACKFSFKGMCKPLSLQGTENVVYTVPFSKKPLKSKIKLLPVGTFAVIYCDKQESGYSVCNNINNTYSWSNPGPFCQLEKQNCGINNGGCEHLCRQDGDVVRCFCKEGYELKKDGFSCRATDLCGPDSCEHLCVTGESGINCRCLKGFGLSENQRNCSDIDECQSEVCQDRVCVNTVGSFLCVCKEGYDMIDGECRDADECARSGCEYSCLNNNGSLSCYCSEGFILSQDGHSCVDVNECVSSPCLSELTCINTVGSFKCTHQQKTDGSTETSLVSITPAAPSDEETQDNFPESLTRTTVELQHQSPHTDTPEPYLHNITNQDHSNRSLATNQTLSRNSRVIICVLGSVIPLLLLVTLTLFIIIFRCSRTKKEVKKKKSTADGYCWVSSGLDPRLEKLYESILTDDL